jgi:hypothetical protein
MSLITHIREDSECCGNCEYWTGPRDIEFNKVIIVDADREEGFGTCMLRRDEKRAYDRVSSCNHWRRWGALD